ncbi:SAM-dependent methyltransferase [Actinomadura rubrisoli]|uniref:Methyltransferase domain-containing protein n=1 Tax=Actinomadura rubrisoli TaxID=2530368 RepID=A0A4R5BAT4_9ACTN|nr:class I SAM-dependent methyltransferase [Actinomadura rubrisoli]TDD81746.1 methyltransferase domain-containing protein [Actinomadura rubrisoli]
MEGAGPSPIIGSDAAAEATNRHYELPPEVFGTFLDRRTKYSCALYPTGTETLDEAQEAKLRFIADLLGLDGGERVLDVGCGWGAITLYLSSLGCRVTAVTPSRVQAGHVRAAARLARVADRVEIRCGGYQDLGLGDRRFDAVVMEEVIEHMPEHGGPIAKAYRELRRGGRLYVSASCYRSRGVRAEFASRPASRRAVELYGYTAMAVASELVGHLEDAGFSVCTLTDLTAQYGITMREWHRRIRAGSGLDDVTLRIGDFFDATLAAWGYTAKLYALTAVRSRMGVWEERTHRLGAQP